MRPVGRSEPKYRTTILYSRGARAGRLGSEEAPTARAPVRRGFRRRDERVANGSRCPVAAAGAGGVVLRACRLAAGPPLPAPSASWAEEPPPLRHRARGGGLASGCLRGGGDVGARSGFAVVQERPCRAGGRGADRPTSLHAQRAPARHRRGRRRAGGLRATQPHRRPDRPRRALEAGWLSLRRLGRRPAPAGPRAPAGGASPTRPTRHRPAGSTTATTSAACGCTRPACRAGTPPATPPGLLQRHPLTMHPLAHHPGEDSLLNLLLGGTGLSLMVVEGHARLAAVRARIARFVRGEGHGG
jgi:hypothetical protein